MKFILYLLLLAGKLMQWSFRLNFHYLFHSKKNLLFYDEYFKKISKKTFKLAKIHTDIKIKIESLNEEKLPKLFLAISNHQTFADIPGIINAFPTRNMRLVGKTALTKMPGISTITQIGQHATINRDSNFKETMYEMKRFANLAKKGYCLHIFPEGTRSLNGKLGIFQQGGIRIILNMVKLPLVSVAIGGGDKFSKINISSLNKTKQYYRVKVLSVYPYPENKEKLNKTLDKIKSEITEQLEIWNN